MARWFAMTALSLALALAPTALAARAEVPPNVLIVQLDDTRWDGIDRMPELDRFAQGALRFSEAFVTSPVCWSSRASLLTGRYARSMGIGPAATNAAGIFRETGSDEQTLATWLQAAGYTTGYFGKYLNGYRFERFGPHHYYIPPGWDRWRSFGTRPGYGGRHGRPYTLVHEDQFARLRTQYSTDLLAEDLIRFVERAPEPFFAFWAPVASHADAGDILPTPAARHLGAMKDLPEWRPPSYDVVHPDQPEWLRAARVLAGPFRHALTDAYRQRAYETLLAVDEQFASILRALPESTVVVFTSDNGVGWGEHGLFFQFKGCPYDECVRVPLIIRAPSLPAGESLRITLNIDIAPIVMGLVGLEIPVPVDGHTNVRGLARFEFDAHPLWTTPSWTAARTHGDLIVGNDTGEFELYGLSRDPHQMNPIGSRWRGRRE